MTNAVALPNELIQPNPVILSFCHPVILPSIILSLPERRLAAKSIA
jgi:hypothetical protein